MKSRWLLIATAVITAGASWYYLLSPVSGAELGERSLRLEDSLGGASTNYLVSFSLATPGQLGSIELEFCANDPMPGTPCTPPAGFDADNAVLVTQTGQVGFSIAATSTANRLVLTRSPSAAGIGPVTYNFTGVINPASPGSYYLRLQTFATADATGPASDYGGIAFAINNQLAVSAQVPPYLIFCTAITIGGNNCANARGDAIDFGELSSSSARSGSSQMLVATNAEIGYNVTAHGTTLTSGNNIINAITNNDVSRPGIGQFGFNLRANSTPAGGSDPSGPGTGLPQPNYNQPNLYRFVSGDTVISHPEPDNVRVYTASYIVNVPRQQSPGVYVSTLTYICLADF